MLRAFIFLLLAAGFWGAKPGAEFVAQQPVPPNDTNVIITGNVKVYRLYNGLFGCKAEYFDFGTDTIEPASVIITSSYRGEVMSLQFKPNGVEINKAIFKRELKSFGYSTNRDFKVLPDGGQGEVFYTGNTYQHPLPGFKVTIKELGLSCDDTGWHSIKVKAKGGDVTFRWMLNVDLFRFDCDGNSKKELYILNWQGCKQHMEIFKIEP